MNGKLWISVSLFVWMSSGCAVVTVATTAASVATTAVSVGVSAAGAVVDVGAAGVKAVVRKDSKDKAEECIEPQHCPTEK